MPRLRPREFLMLPRVYNQRKCTVGGYYISEKLGGIRAFWDGGISRGISATVVPWANVKDPKTGWIKPNARQPVSGLWSCNANPILAPDWFLNLLPCMPLDGVLWAGRSNRAICHNACLAGAEHDGWEEIEFAIFSTPPIDKIFGDGVIQNDQMLLKLQGVNLDTWLHACNPSMAKDWYRLISGDIKITFDAELAVLREAIPSEGRVYLHRQKRLPFSVKDAARTVESELKCVHKLGGDGVIMRDPDGCWEPKRTPTLLEYECSF